MLNPHCHAIDTVHCHLSLSTCTLSCRLLFGASIVSFLSPILFLTIMTMFIPFLQLSDVFLSIFPIFSLEMIFVHVLTPIGRMSYHHVCFCASTHCSDHMTLWDGLQTASLHTGLCSGLYFRDICRMLPFVWFSPLFGSHGFHCPLCGACHRSIHVHSSDHSVHHYVHLVCSF